MRHNVYGKHLGRDKNQRTALFRGLVRALVLNESINTTESKAKAIKGLVDKLISAAKTNSPASKRVIQSFLPQTEVSQKLMQDIAPRFQNRPSGFTNLVKLGIRAGDGAMMVKMSLVKEEQKLNSPEELKQLEESKKEEVKEEKIAKKEEKRVRVKKGDKKV